MKPINLKVKGLNSFIEIQEINFEKLTKEGLFGIFGPTGSGKSTILDGITLALYGEVARKSSNYMNTNCNSLNVSYEFQISEKEVKRYRVEREFKRDTKTDSVRTKSAKIVSIEGNNETVLEDKITLVTKKCEEIIGLNLTDFTRTVVLPQGNFSEFLKLEGKERRNMLERLFNLQMYGDELSYKLAAKSKRERETASLLEGELKSYEDCSEEIIEEKRKEQESCEEKYKQELKFSKEVEQIFDENKELWGLQEELGGYKKDYHKLKVEEEEINSYRLKVSQAERALKVKPYLDNYKETYSGIQNATDELSKASEIFTKIDAEKVKCELVYQTAKAKKTDEIPVMIVKEQLLKDAILQQKELFVLIEKSKQLQQHMDEKISNKAKLLKEKTENETEIKIISTKIENNSKEIETLKTPEDYKERIRVGLNIQERFEASLKEVNVLDIKINAVKEELESNKSNNVKFQENSNNFEEIISRKSAELNELLQKAPTDQQDLINLSSKITTVEAGELKYKEYSTLLEKSNLDIKSLKKSLDKGQKEKTLIEDEITNLESEIKRINTENIVHILKATLAEEDVCPVCGGKYHLNEEVDEFKLEEIDHIEVKLSTQKSKLASLNEELAKYFASVAQEEKNVIEYTYKIQELTEACGANLSGKLKEEYEFKKQAFEMYNTLKDKLNNEIAELKDKKVKSDNELIKYKTLITENEKKLLDLHKDLEYSNQIKEDAFEQLNKLKAELEVEDLKAKQAEIWEKENRKNELENDLKDLRSELENKQVLGKQFDEQINIINTDIVEKKTALNETSENIASKKSNIISKVGGDEELEDRLLNLTNSMKEIEDSFNKAEFEKNEATKTFEEMKDKVTELSGRLNSLKERLDKEKLALDEAIKEEGFTDLLQVENVMLDKSIIATLKATIESYDQSINELQIKMKDIQNKIGVRSLNNEQWDEIQRKKLELEENLSKIRDLLVTGRDTLKNLEVRLLNKNSILTKKREIDRKIGLIDDLEKLFKGKKFIEYVAINQLKYVAVEACKKLKEITGGMYGIEVDENGKFLIRDYKNGGATRDASTLSGGETFLASLSLALALSAQIQLKGTAPLELFFLDEGFGTLDDNLLEIVMDSLEKIHNDKLSVGIISHLDAIKNRIPVKLVITPAQAGLGGSKVKIERN